MPRELHIDRNIRTALARREQPLSHLATGSHAHRSVVYRILNGFTRDPRTGTLIEICQQIGASFNEIVGHSPLIENEETFNEMQKLSDPEKRRAIELIKIFVDTKDVR